MRRYLLGRSKLCLIALITSLLISPVAIADEKAVKTKQLKALLTKIDKLKQTIDVKEDSKSRYIAQLKNIESKISAVSKKIRRRTNGLKGYWAVFSLFERGFPDEVALI